MSRLGDGATLATERNDEVFAMTEDEAIFVSEDMASYGAKDWNHTRLRVYKEAMDAAMVVFEVTKNFPKEERYSLVDQFRRSARSICANIAEAWRKRRYPAHFISKLSDAEAEAAESLVWCEISQRCGYIDEEFFQSLSDRFDKILRQLVLMISQPEKWRQ